MTTPASHAPRAAHLHHLHHAVVGLLEQLERLARGRGTLDHDPERDEFETWLATFNVHEVLRAGPGIPQEVGEPIGVFDAERWLCRLLRGTAARCPEPVPRGWLEHAERLSAPEGLEALREVLARLPDPFAGPRGDVAALRDWANHHLELEPEDWNPDIDPPRDFARRWHGALFVDGPLGPEERQPSEVVAARRALLVEAGFLRGPEAPGGATPRPEVADDAYLALIHEHMKGRRGVQARLLEYMQDRERAQFHDIAAEVHGDEQTTDGAIRANVTRVNESLAGAELPIRFTVGAGCVFKSRDAM